MRGTPTSTVGRVTRVGWIAFSSKPHALSSPDSYMHRADERKRAFLFSNALRSRLIYGVPWRGGGAARRGRGREGDKPRETRNSNDNKTVRRRRIKKMRGLASVRGPRRSSHARPALPHSSRESHLAAPHRTRTAQHSTAQHSTAPPPQKHGPASAHPFLSPQPWSMASVRCRSSPANAERRAKRRCSATVRPSGRRRGKRAGRAKRSAAIACGENSSRGTGERKRI